MRISIALATYNGEKFLEEQLESFSKQSHLPYEVIISDDCSTDKTLEIALNYQARAPFKVIVITNDLNVGYVKNFERAIERCTGDIICLSDQDDVWMAQKLFNVASFFDQDTTAMVVTNNHLITDSELRPSGYTTLGNVRKMKRADNSFMHGCCTSFRSSMVPIILPMGDGMSHDAWIGKLSDALGIRRVKDEILQYYRKHDANASLWFTSLPTPKSRLGEILRYGLQDARSGWTREIDSLAQTATRIKERSTQMDKAGIDSAIRSSALCRIEKRIDSIGERIKIVSSPRARRAPRVARFLWRGGYKHFQGVASAIKDLFR